MYVCVCVKVCVCMNVCVCESVCMYVWVYLRECLCVWDMGFSPSLLWVPEIKLVFIGWPLPAESSCRPLFCFWDMVCLHRLASNPQSLCLRSQTQSAPRVHIIRICSMQPVWDLIGGNGNILLSGRLCCVNVISSDIHGFVVEVWFLYLPVVLKVT